MLPRLWLLVGSDRPTDRQCQLLSCPGQLKKIFVVSLCGQRWPCSQVIPILWLNIFFTTLNLNWDEEEIHKNHIHNNRVYDEVAFNFTYLIQCECVSYFFLFNCPSQSANKKRQFPSLLTRNSLLTSPKIGPSRCARNTLYHSVTFCNTL